MRARKSFSIFLLFVLLAPLCAFAEEKDELLKKATEAATRNDRKRADFYATRWIGLCAKEGASSCEDPQLDAFLQKRQLEPKGFIPDQWDPEFIEWFEKGIRDRWGTAPERVREKSRSFEITQNTYQERFYVTVSVYPELESWHVLKDGLISRPLLMTMAGYKDHPTLFFGKSLHGISFESHPVFIDTQRRTVHYFYRPEFYDLDGDGTPEVWVRFNLAWGNGFAQVLDVYSIRNGKDLVLLQHFQGGPDGYARRLEDGSVEVAIGERILMKKQKIETWEYKKGAFAVTSKKEIPSVLLGSKWKDIYLE